MLTKNFAYKICLQFCFVSFASTVEHKSGNSKEKVCCIYPYFCSIFFFFDVPRFILFFLFPLLFLTAFKILFFCLVFRISNMIVLCRFLWVVSVWGLLKFLSLYVYIFCQVWKRGIYINAAYICVYICIYTLSLWSVFMIPWVLHFWEIFVFFNLFLSSVNSHFTFSF